MAKHTPTQTFTDMAGTRRCNTCATPPYMPPTCSSVSETISAHAQISQLTPRRGPGTRLNPSSAVWPVAMV